MLAESAVALVESARMWALEIGLEAGGLAHPESARTMTAALADAGRWERRRTRWYLIRAELDRFYDNTSRNLRKPMNYLNIGVKTLYLTNIRPHLAQMPDWSREGTLRLQPEWKLAYLRLRFARAGKVAVDYAVTHFPA